MLQWCKGLACSPRLRNIVGSNPVWGTPYSFKMVFSFLPLAYARGKTSWHKGLPVVKTIYTYGFHELFLKQILLRVWRCQKGNQNPYIEEEQATQWPKEKVQKDKQRSTKHTYKARDRVTRTPLKAEHPTCYTRENKVINSTVSILNKYSLAWCIDDNTCPFPYQPERPPRADVN